MDGNGRWANERGKSRIDGHKKGVDVVREVIKYSIEYKIKYLTLFTFSSENWNRPKKEILNLMNLLVRSLDLETQSLIKNDVKLKVIGDLSNLDSVTRGSLKKVVDLTKNNKTITLVLAISYGGRQEIISAVNKILLLDNKKITLDMFSSFLYTKDIPDPDLLIRTGKEKRISNFLLWQTSYTEIYFSDLYWPDFNKKELDKALLFFNKCNRKFGKIND
ncbi:MAG: di-trans,poly-cis-decaprenylcistransferase [Candidatus Marinimicrobia bacterium]|nr:di-trans,poly-cis-decaprenylcistransferase [Candidatus Neomarinimicrobiota bacterium]